MKFGYSILAYEYTDSNEYIRPNPLFASPIISVVTSLCMAFVMSFRDVTRTLIGGGGGIFMYSCSA